eukprot:570249-Pyramimonas_sp.AAC.1
MPPASARSTLPRLSGIRMCCCPTSTRRAACGSAAMPRAISRKPARAIVNPASCKTDSTSSCAAPSTITPVGNTSRTRANRHA